MKTLINWININDNLPKMSDKILIYTKYCKNKIDVWYYNWKDFFCWNCKTYNVEYWANMPDILDNN